jgi:hypothetical protein
MSDKPSFFAELKRRNDLYVSLAAAPRNLIDPLGTFVGRDQNQ